MAAEPGVDEQLIRQHIQELKARPAFSRDRARGALVEMGRPAVGALVAALGETQPWARKAAADALGEIGDPAAREALALVQESDPDALVRRAARIALQWLESMGEAPNG